LPRISLISNGPHGVISQKRELSTLRFDSEASSEKLLDIPRIRLECAVNLFETVTLEFLYRPSLFKSLRFRNQHLLTKREKYVVFNLRVVLPECYLCATMLK
jgi:hypothetical protein